MNNNKQPKKVSFLDDDSSSSELTTSYPCVPLSSEILPEERNLLWFNKKDYSNFKATLTTTAREVRKYGYGNLLENAFDDTPDSIKYLQLWIRHNSLARGTERYCNQNHRLQRRILQQECIQKVLEAQTEMKDISNFNDIDNSTRIAEISRNSSDLARKFSIRMGQADALAVQPKSNNMNIYRLRSRISFVRKHLSTSPGVACMVN